MTALQMGTHPLQADPLGSELDIWAEQLQNSYVGVVTRGKSAVIVDMRFHSPGYYPPIKYILGITILTIINHYVHFPLQLLLVITALNFDHHQRTETKGRPRNIPVAY